jgi:hypothetical protein
VSGADDARYVLLGLAHARASWFRDVARWSTAGSLPVEFVKCLTPDELRAHLRSGRPFSALVVDAGSSAADRDLLALARQAGCPALIVDDGRSGKPWSALGATEVLPASLDRDALLQALDTHCRQIRQAVEPVHVGPAPATPALWRGRLVAVTGGGGTGTSITAMALAQGFGRDARSRGLVVLADLARRADQAVLHDAGDVLPGVQELVDAHRHGTTTAESVRAHTFHGSDRGYDLLLGLRRPTDWTAMPPRAFAAAVDSLRRAYTTVIADVDPDLEGERETGSIDVEDRNLMTRTIVTGADLVVVTGRADVHGIHRLLAVLHDLVRFGVAPDRLLPVVTGAPRSTRARAEMTRTIGLLGPTHDDRAMPSALHLGPTRRLVSLLRDGEPLPASLTHAVTAAARAVLDRASTPVSAPAVDDPEPVRPGSLGSWSDEETA